MSSDIAAHRRQVESLAKEIQDLKTRIEKLRPDDQEVDPDVLARVAKSAGVQPVKSMLKQRRALRGHFGKVYSVQWSSDSKRLCSAAQDGKVMLWNCQAGVKIHVVSLRSTWVMSCGYSPTGSLVASGGLDNTVTVHKLPDQLVLNNAVKVSEVALSLPLLSLSLSLSVSLSLSSRSFSPRRPPLIPPSLLPHFPQAESKEMGDAHVTAELNGHEGYISYCKFLDDSSMLTASGDGSCALFDITTQHLRTAFKGHDQDVMALSSFDQNTFVSCSVDTTARLWDCRAGGRAQKVFNGHESDVNAVCTLGNGLGFITGSEDTSCRLFDLRAYQQLSVYHSPKLLCGVTSVALSKSSKFLYAGYDLQDFWVWDVQLGAPSQVVEKSHENRVACLAVSPNGHGLASGSWDYALKIWA